MPSVIYGAQRKSHSLLTVPHVNPADHTGAPGRTRLSHVQSQYVVKVLKKPSVLWLQVLGFNEFLCFEIILRER